MAETAVCRPSFSLKDCGKLTVTVHILTETFLLSAIAALIALLISWKLRGSGIEK